MARIPTDWTETNLTAERVCTGEPLARAAGITFWEHPRLGDLHPILAVTLDKIGPKGPIVWNTHDFDIPEYL
jgi:hypothetical protein